MFDLCYCCRCCIFGICVVYVNGDVVCCCLLLLLLSPLVVVFVVLTSFSADQDETKNVHKPRLSFLYWFTFRYFFRARLITDTCSFIYVHLSFRQDLRYINFTLSYRTIVFDIIFITIPCIWLLFTRLWSSKVSYSTKTCIYNTLQKQNPFL